MAIILNGTTSVLQSASFGAARPAAYSFAIWARIDPSAPIGSTGLIANLGNSAGFPNDKGDALLYFGHPNSGNRFRPALHSDDANNYISTDTAGSSSTGVWRHFAVTYSATRFRYYEDGIQIGGTRNATVIASAPSDWSLSLGRRHDGTESLACRQAFIGYWDAELDTVEVSALGKAIAPLHVRPQSLQYYVTGLRDANAMRGVTANATNLTYTDDNPRIYL